MNNTKKINVNYSSLVGLKAELLKKQAEVKEAKAKIETDNAVPNVKIKNKRPKEENKNEPKRAELTDVDDINMHKKSRLMLEAKTRLYERLKKSKRTNENFLVDFTTKSDESEDEHFKEEDYDDSFSDPEDSWVEYEDCFGRTRKCLRKDLPLMQKKDNLVKREVMKHKESTENNNKHVEEPRPPVQVKEPEIEIMRKKWEEQEQKLADKTDIHYQDILFDEARAHGVGYYAFSQDEEERAKQQENLVKLRKQTEQKQKEMKELRDLKDKMEQNRLKAARIRKRVRAGLPAEPTEEELAQENKNNTINTAENANTDTTRDDTSKENSKVNGEDEKEKERAKAREDLIAIENKIQAFGELLGKKAEWREMSQDEWVAKCREQRISEFGPVYDNFKRGGYLNEVSTSDDQKIDDAEEETQSQDVKPSNIKENCISTSVNDCQQKSPDSLMKTTSTDILGNSCEKDTDIIGPLPPTDTSSNVHNLGNSCEEDTDIIGPLPPTNTSSNVDNLDNSCEEGTDVIGPLPPTNTSSNVDNLDNSCEAGTDIIGPLPPTDNSSYEENCELNSSPTNESNQNVPDTCTDSLLSIPVPPIPQPETTHSELQSIPIPPLPTPEVQPVPPPMMIPPMSLPQTYNDSVHPYSQNTYYPVSTDPTMQANEYYYTAPFQHVSPMPYMYSTYSPTNLFVNTTVPSNVNINTEMETHNSTESSENNSTSNDATVASSSTHRIKEEDIAAGLRYLREKFEKGQNC